MKRIRFLAWVSAVLLLSGPAAAGGRLKAEDLKSFEQRASYALGLEIGSNLKDLPVEIEMEIFMQGLLDRMQGRDELMTSAEAAELKREIVAEVRKVRKARRREKAEANRKKGETFLAENAKKKGVKVTKSGLQYLVLKEGSGPKPSADDTVKVHYKGTLIDGTEFDSSYKRGRPATFPLRGVIRGWTEGLQLMPVGSTYRFFIPSNLAYGDRGSGARIGPGETLIFDVELLEIVKKGKD